MPVLREPPGRNEHPYEMEARLWRLHPPGINVMLHSTILVEIGAVIRLGTECRMDFACAFAVYDFAARPFRHLQRGNRYLCVANDLHPAASLPFPPLSVVVSPSQKPHHAFCIRRICEPVLRRC